jgi:hypothetical protein
MQFSAWLALTDVERDKMSQKLNPLEDWDLFKAVESEFRSKFAQQRGVGKVFCGLAAGLGPYNSITVEILRDQPRTKLPKRFLGFPVLRSYHKKNA